MNEYQLLRVKRERVMASVKSGGPGWIVVCRYNSACLHSDWSMGDRDGAAVFPTKNDAGLMCCSLNEHSVEVW